MSEALIRKYYYDPTTGFSSAEKLYRKLKPLDASITLKKIKEFISKQLTAQVNKPIQKAKEFSSIFSPNVGNNFQMDIMVYDRYAYNKYKYILVCVDVYSRYAEARAMTSRTMPMIMKNVKEIFASMGTPKNLNADNDFNKKEFNAYAKDNAITTFYSQPDEINKNAVVERLNRTIAELLQKWRVATKRYDWAKVLSQIMTNYNNTYHSTIKAEPSAVFQRQDINHQKYKKLLHKFAVGDQVRVQIEKKVFAKNDVIKYSRAIETIERIDKDRIYLVGIAGYVKPIQLQLVKSVEEYELPEADDKDYEINIALGEEKIHKQQVKARKENRVLAKEGVERNEVALRRTARERKVNQLEDQKYGKLIY